MSPRAQALLCCALQHALAVRGKIAIRSDLSRRHLSVLVDGITGAFEALQLSFTGVDYTFANMARALGGSAGPPS
jgi:hypothetical protein